MTELAQAAPAMAGGSTVPGFTGRVALVTGAGGDIGRAVARRLAAGGATVVLADVPGAVEGLSQTERLCAQVGAPDLVHVRRFDVTDVAAVEGALASIAGTLGAPDLLVNNAGYQGAFRTLIDYPLTDVRKVLEVNVVGVFAVMQACARHLVAEGRPGAIVNIASMAGVSGAPNMVAYSASKGAVIALTKSAAKDLAPAGIRVNAVSPAFIGPGAMWTRQVQQQADTPSQYYGDDPAEVERQMIDQVPLRRYGTLDEVAAVVAFLLSDDASYLTGTNTEVAGGAG